MSGFRYSLHGIQETITRLASFKTRFKRKALTKAGNAGSKVALAGLKALAPKQTGTWRKSLGRRVRVYLSGEKLFYVVGPRMGFITQATITPPANLRVRPIRKSKHWPDGTLSIFWRDKRTGKIVARPLTKKYNPVKYSHLMDKGTSRSKGHHAVARAAQQTRDAEFSAVTTALAEVCAEI